MGRRRATAEWEEVVFAHPNVSAPCKLTLLFLARHMKASGQVSMPRAEIAARLATSERPIDRHIAEARRNGLLDLVAAGRRGRTAVYKRVFPSGVSAPDIARCPPSRYTENDSHKWRANENGDPRNSADSSQIARYKWRTTTTEPGTSSHLDHGDEKREAPSSPQASTSPGERATPAAALGLEDQSSNPIAAAAPSADQGEGSEDWQQFNSLTTEEKLRFRQFAGAKSLGLYARTLDRDGDLGLKLAEWRTEEQAAAEAQKQSQWDQQVPTLTSSEWDPGVDCWDMAERRDIEPGGDTWNDLLANFRRENPKGMEVHLNRRFVDYLDEYHRRTHARFCRSCGQPVDEPHDRDCMRNTSNRPKYCYSCAIDLWDGSEHTTDCAEHKITQGAA